MLCTSEAIKTNQKVLLSPPICVWKVDGGEFLLVKPQQCKPGQRKKQQILLNRCAMNCLYHCSVCFVACRLAEQKLHSRNYAQHIQQRCVVLVCCVLLLLMMLHSSSRRPVFCILVPHSQLAIKAIITQRDLPTLEACSNNCYNDGLCYLGRYSTNNDKSSHHLDSSLSGITFGV